MLTASIDNSPYIDAFGDRYSQRWKSILPSLPLDRRKHVSHSALTLPFITLQILLNRGRFLLSLILGIQGMSRVVLHRPGRALTDAQIPLDNETYNKHVEMLQVSILNVLASSESTAKDLHDLHSSSPNFAAAQPA